jgi:hypothetical protein
MHAKNGIGCDFAGVCASKPQSLTIVRATLAVADNSRSMLPMKMACSRLPPGDEKYIGR